MPQVQRTAKTKASELAGASSGFGPLLQRDYWAVIEGCRLSPSQVMQHVLEDFERFAPAELVVFKRGEPRRMEQDDELDVRIAGAVKARVRVLHRDAQSVTLGTITGHPEAGRITFGAYRNGRGDVIFHIRSRARSSSWLRFFGFLGAGEPMQTNTWTDFVNHVAAATGKGVIGWIHADTRRIEDEPDEVARSRPTFVARGD